MNHPNNLDGIYTILGLQGEEKAGRKGMQTVLMFFLSVRLKSDLLVT